MEVKSLFFKPGGNIPNNEILPVVIYKKVFIKEIRESFKKSFAENGWKGSWVNGIFNYHHYHSTAHEVLGILSGNGEVILGGPAGRATQLAEGDMVVLPAGTGHCLTESSHDFKVIGAYPGGQENYDICTQQDDFQKKMANIVRVLLPAKDPVHGSDGPLKHLWT